MMPDQPRETYQSDHVCDRPSWHLEVLSDDYGVTGQRIWAPTRILVMRPIP